MVDELEDGDGEFVPELFVEVAGEGGEEVAERGELLLVLEEDGETHDI